MDFDKHDHQDQDFLFIQQTFEGLQNDQSTQLEYLRKQIGDYLGSHDDPSETRSQMMQEFDYQKQYQKQIFQLFQALLQSGQHSQERISQVNDELHESQKISSQYHTQNDSLQEEQRRFEQRIRNLEQELEHSENKVELLRQENNHLKNDIQNAKLEKQQLRNDSEQMIKSKQSSSETYQQETINKDQKLKELEDKVAEKSLEITKLMKRYDELKRSSTQLERKLVMVNVDIVALQDQKEEEVQQLTQIIEEKQLTIDQLSSEMLQKDIEIKKFMMQESQYKTQEQHNALLMSKLQRNDSQASDELMFEEDDKSNHQPHKRLVLPSPTLLGRQRSGEELSTGATLPSHRSDFDHNDQEGSILKVGRSTQTNELDFYSHDVEQFYSEYQYSEIADDDHRHQMQMMQHHEFEDSMPLSSPADTIKKNLEEEFFKLSVLSAKMIHNEKYPDFVVELNPKKLYKEALNEKVSFQHWQFWIYKKVFAIGEIQKAQQKPGFLSRLKNYLSEKKPQQPSPGSKNSSFISSNHSEKDDPKSSFAKSNPDNPYLTPQKKQK